MAKTIGDDAALQIYKHLLQHTFEVTKDLKVAKQVFYSEEILQQDLWNSENFNKKLQNGADLGEKMENAFKNAFKNGFEQVIIIGSDLLELNSAILEEAFSELEKNDVVIGPAKDGGYYLLGMKELKPEIFRNKNWSTATVLSETLVDVNNEKVALLKELNDIDVYDDIKDNEELKNLIK